MKFTTSIALLLLQQSASVFADRPAQWSDWEAVKEHFVQRVIDSTCPDAGHEALKTHWDYDYEGYLQTMSEEEALNQDCTLFHRFRNPGPLGTRLIRHAFHDAAGGFNGFVNVHDLKENPGLHATTIVLRDDYNTLEVPDGDNGETVPIKQIISFADFTAWAAHAALLRTVNLQNLSDEGRPVEEEPLVEVRVGRPAYEPTSGNDHGPTEYFPTGLGAQGSGQLIADYFANEFGFTATETVTILGAHTLGGARREDSGFSGMWTQSKGKFNNDYQKQIVFPLPELCVGGPDNCSYFSQAGNDILADNGLKQTCFEGEDSDRCQGWQQTMRHGIGEIPDKFQWQHSCKDDGTGCTHLMLNIDIGMFYNLDGYICTAEDEADGVDATAGRTCKEGMIKDYPPNSHCNKDDSRVLATCFEINEDTNIHLVYDADDMNAWVQEFGLLFDRLLTHKMLEGKQVSDLTILTPPAPCENNPSWVYTTPVRKNGSGGDDRTCNYVNQNPNERCSLDGNDGTPAHEACCSACEGFDPNQEPDQAACENDLTWIYVTPVRQNGSGGEEKNCNYVKQRPDERCDVDGSDGTPAYEACCSACEGYIPNRGEGAVESGPEEESYDSSTIFEADFGEGFGSSAKTLHQFAVMSVAVVGATLFLF